MGQDCCYSSKDQHSDLRQSRPRKTKDKTLEQNTFKRQLEGKLFNLSYQRVIAYKICQL